MRTKRLLLLFRGVLLHRREGGHWEGSEVPHVPQTSTSDRFPSLSLYCYSTNDPQATFRRRRLYSDKSSIVLAGDELSTTKPWKPFAFPREFARSSQSCHCLASEVVTLNIYTSRHSLFLSTLASTPTSLFILEVPSRTSHRSVAANTTQHDSISARRQKKKLSDANEK